MSAFFAEWPPEALEVAGVCGFALYVTNYVLVTLRRIHSDQIRFYAMNWLAASLVLVGLMGTFNLASALIQIFWICISIVGIFIRFRRRYRREATFTSVRVTP